MRATTSTTLTAARLPVMLTALGGASGFLTG